MPSSQGPLTPVYCFKGKGGHCPTLPLFLVPTPLHGGSSNSLHPAFPVWWPFSTSPRGREGGRDQPQTLCPSRTGEGVGPGSQEPSPQSCTHKHTPLHRAAAVHTVTHKHRPTYSNPQGQQAAREEATHTHKTPVIRSQENINHKHAVPARFGDRVKMKIIMLTRIMSPDLPRSGQVSTVNRL